MRNSIILLTCTTIAAAITTAHAQNQPGSTQYNTITLPAMISAQQAASSSPGTGGWTSVYINTADNTIYGSRGAYSNEWANRRARLKCRQSAKILHKLKCKYVASYANVNLAVAQGDDGTPYLVANQESLDSVEARALSQCRERTTNCATTLAGDSFFSD